MRGQAHATSRRISAIAIGGVLLLGTVPMTASATAEAPSALPHCSDPAGAGSDDGVVLTPWHTLLDEQGAVTGHRLRFRHGGVERELRGGRRSFSLPGGTDRLLVGERSAHGTRLDMIDTRRACRVWSRDLPAHAYPAQDAGERRLLLAIHDRDTRDYRRSQALDAETGATEGESQEACLEGCYPTDGGLSPAALEPAGSARPTPSFPAGGWVRDRTLAFRWTPGAVPPTWARSTLKAAADDAKRTSHSRSPRFPYRTGASNAIAYSGTLPGFCSSRAIACARRAMPSYWGVWIRPHGTDYSWGTLRWCQKTSSAHGCLDLRRVALHELGHIVGLDHPSNAGFTLSGSDSIMQGITPARPMSGSSRHAFGRCDVATLQELYDTPDNKTAISTCNDVATTVTLSASRGSILSGGKVTLTAGLRVDDRSAYRQLAGNPLNGRSLKLKYRALGGGAWKTAWMRSLYSSGRYVLAITPTATWEFKAVFPTPTDEGLRYSRSAVRKVKVTNR